VVTVADRYGVKVPLNEKIVSMISEIEDGTRDLGYHNIEEGNAYAQQLGIALP
jgi:2-dehydropantoate 2-reductase